MQKKSLLRLTLVAFLASIFWLSCNKSDLENAKLGDHTAEFAFPLFNTDVKLKDLLFNVLNDTLSGDTIIINPDNSMTLYYSGDVAQKPATDIFAFLTQGGIVPLSDTVITNPIQAPSGVTIRQAVLNAGQIRFLISNSFSDTLRGYFEIPEMSLNGVTFKIPFVVPPGAINTIYGPFDITGYALNSNSNTLTFRYYAYLPDGTRVKITNLAGVLVSYQGLTFSYVEGYWGFQEYHLTRDTIEIDINQTDLKGNVKVVSPKVTMRIRNSWGFPTRGVIKYLSFIGQNGEELQLHSTAFQNNGTDDYADFAYPSYALGEVGQEKYTDIVLDSSNSNIVDIFNLQPKQLIYEVDGVSNAQHDPTLIGFITDESILALQMKVEMVLEGSAQNFGAEQTLDLNFGEFSSLDSAGVESVEFKLVTENGTPVDINAQIYFRDEADNNIDSLFTDGLQAIMKAAPINSAGIANGITRNETFVPMTATRFDKIRAAKTAFLKAYFTTAQGGTTPVRLLADNATTIKMGVKVKKRITGE